MLGYILDAVPAEGEQIDRQQPNPYVNTHARILIFHDMIFGDDLRWLRDVDRKVQQGIVYILMIQDAPVHLHVVFGWLCSVPTTDRHGGQPDYRAEPHREQRDHDELEDMDRLRPKCGGEFVQGEV